MRVRELMEALSRFDPGQTVGIKLEYGRGDITWRTFGGVSLTARPDVVQLVLGDSIPAPEAEVIFFEWGAACGSCGRHMHIATDGGDFVDAYCNPLDTKAKVIDAFRGPLEKRRDEHGELVEKRWGYAQKGDRMRVVCDCGAVNFVEFDE